MDVETRLPAHLLSAPWCVRCAVTGSGVFGSLVFTSVALLDQRKKGAGFVQTGSGSHRSRNGRPRPWRRRPR